MFRRILCGVVALSVSSCSSVPSFDLTANGPPFAPAGPKVASLVANLKCELFEAANSQQMLPRYFDDPSLQQHYDQSVPGQEGRYPDPKRLFTLKNLFEEIEYVGEAQFELDVQQTAGIAPSANFIHPYTAATNLTLSVGGNLSEQAHRYTYLYFSIDFERLVKSPPYDGVNREGPLAYFAATEPPQKGTETPSVPCGGRTELGGTLGIQESLSYYFITGDMNDIAVFETPPAAGKAASPSAATKIPATGAQYVVGQIQAQMDFTITAGVNGGPNWTLTHFKGPAAGTLPFLSFSRVVKDTLLLTFIPVCIRQKYKPLNTSAPYKYVPELVEGTPRWANYLPPCSTIGGAGKSNALGAAHNYNLINAKGLVPLSL